MIAVNSVASTAATALKLISATTGNSATAAKPALGINPTSTRVLSPSVSDALLKIGEIINRKAPQALSDLPPSHAEKLRALGADAAIKVTPNPVSDAEFQAMVLAHGKEHWGNLDGFSEALANGTLKIQRASDVPELGLGSVQYDLYSGGNHIGGAGFGSGDFNKSLYLDIQAQGIRQATGSVNGHDFYVTWPDATLAKAA